MLQDPHFIISTKHKILIKYKSKQFVINCKLEDFSRKGSLKQILAKTPFKKINLKIMRRLSSVNKNGLVSFTPLISSNGLNTVKEKYPDLELSVFDYLTFLTKNTRIYYELDGRRIIVIILSNQEFLILWADSEEREWVAKKLIGQFGYDTIAISLFKYGGSIWLSQITKTEKITPFKLKVVIENANHIFRKCSIRAQAYFIKFAKGKVIKRNITLNLHPRCTKSIKSKSMPSSINICSISNNKIDMKDVSIFGVVTKLYKVGRFKASKTKMIMFKSAISIPNIGNINVMRSVNSGGTGEHLYDAKMKAYVEALERYCSGVLIPEDQKKIKLSEIKELAQKIVGYRVDGLDKRYGENTPNVSGLSESLYPSFGAKEITLSENGFKLEEHYTFIPIDLVYYPLSRDKDKRFYFSSSSGCSAHTSYYQSIISGLLELIERDSISCMWLNKLSLPIYDESSLPKQIRDRVSELKKASNCNVFLLDATLDKSVPTAIALAINKNGFPAFHMGAASSLNSAHALSKALREIEGPLYFSETIYSKPLLRMLPEAVNTVRDHYTYYHDPRNAHDLEFISRGGIVKYKHIKLDHRDLKYALKSIGGNLFVADMTNSIMANKGLVLTRVLSTELVPIWFGRKCIPFDKSRIYKIRDLYSNFVLDKTSHENMFLHPMG